ncbi:MAG TPA: MBL fold metallo-hydrolase [Rhodothermales bacterium]
MDFLALGNTDAIGASCHFLKIGETGIVLDAGADPEAEGPDSVPRYEALRDNTSWYVDHAVITHAHHDHVGSLPLLIREFPHVLVHMTRPTRDLIDVLLPASARLQRRRQREGSSPYEPLFEEAELELQSYLYLTHDLEVPFDLTGIRGGTTIRGTLYSAGHILGSVGVLLEFDDGAGNRRVFYTSDTNLRPQSIIPGADYPEPPIDVLILESTLGADPEAELTTRKTEEKRLAEALRRTIARGGAVLMPVFALGRAQEILALIGSFKRRGILPDDLPVYTAGSMRAVADLYDKTRYSTPRLNPEFQVFEVEQKRLPRSLSGKLAAMSEPGIFLVSSGMMFERTLSNELAKYVIERPENAILLVGFAREDSPAERLLRAASNGAEAEVVLDPLIGPQPLRCEVQRFRFSGHSHRRDLIQLVERLKPKKVVLVHGEEKARQWMSDNVSFFYPDIELVLPHTGVPLEL